jgi:hypothetical protein
MKSNIDDVKIKVSKYLTSQIYNIDLDVKIEDVLEMSIEEIREHAYLFDNISYITCQLLLMGAPKQYIFDDINKFIHYYVIVLLTNKPISESAMKGIIRSAVKILNPYKKFSEDLVSLLIEYINNKTDEIISMLEEKEEFESCGNLLNARKHLLSII